jgi:acyl carrier protein
MENIEQKIVKIIVKQLKVEVSAVTPEKEFITDLGADSLDMVELMMDIEDEFHIDLNEEIAETLTTVGAVIKHVETSLVSR